jgi:hypothetical protein
VDGSSYCPGGGGRTDQPTVPSDKYHIVLQPCYKLFIVHPVLSAMLKKCDDISVNCFRSLLNFKRCWGSVTSFHYLHIGCVVDSCIRGFSFTLVGRLVRLCS